MSYLIKLPLLKFVIFIRSFSNYSLFKGYNFEVRLMEKKGNPKMLKSSWRRMSQDLLRIGNSLDFGPSSFNLNLVFGISNFLDLVSKLKIWHFMVSLTILVFFTHFFFFVRGSGGKGVCTIFRGCDWCWWFVWLVIVRLMVLWNFFDSCVKSFGC